MENSGKQQWILSLALILMLCLAPASSEGILVVSNCSRYEFNKHTNDWTASKIACGFNNGTLVAMETKAEWEFVKNQIQEIDVGNNEWFISLIKKDKVWEWINGQTLTYTDKWYGGLSTDKTRRTSIAKMIKLDDRYRKGMFDDVPHNYRSLPFICEYPIVSNECTKHARTTSSTIRTTTVSSLISTPVTTTKVVKLTATTATTTTKPTPTKPPTTTSKSSDPTKSTAKKQTSESRIITSIPTSHTAFLNTKTEVKETPKSAVSTTVGKPKDHQKSDNKQDDGMMIIYIAVSLAVVLVILICVLGVCYWKRLKKEKRKISEDKLIDSSMATSPQPTTTANVNEIMKSSSFVAFKMVHNNLSDSTAPSGGPVYDTVCTDNNQGVDKGSQLTDTNEGSQGNQNVSVKKKKFSLKRNKGSVSESNRISKADEVKMNEVSASTSTDDNKNSDEVVYAAVDKTKKKKVTEEVTYADLAPFNNNAEVNVHKPEPYQPVEYAVIIGKKASKSSK